jgi:phosphatidate cytidylyltransferase
VLAQRLATAVVGIPLLVVVLLLGRPFIAVVVLGLAVLAGIEAFRLLRQAGYPALGGLGTAIGVALVLEGAIAGGPEGKGLLFLVVGILLATVGAFLRADPREGLGAWMTTVFGALYVGLLGFLPRLPGLALAVPAGAPLAGYLDGGRWWLVVAVLGVWAYDTGAYVTGRLVGGPRFLTGISPSKTWAGLVGGLVAVTVVSAGLLVGLGRDASEALLLGPLIGLAAQAGDLAESMLKRAAGAKDSGRLFPGHGGVLDRVDSLLFAAPVVYLYVAVGLR